MTKVHNTIVGLDIGAARIGVATASIHTQLAQPYSTIAVNDSVFVSIYELCKKVAASELVVGLPRNLNGDETEQTAMVRAFTARLSETIALPIHFQDEAGTSKQAEAELRRIRKTHKSVSGHISVDSLAATYILEDYLREGAHE